ncbi:hypothetical protein AURDEDRAFT_123610 [Auricularia subglabra TFB-10046 SS5]|nr:hypothetical protein AURDEDRAFT_123610 [Auricularia subglabra TFB-10046 SS5]
MHFFATSIILALAAIDMVCLTKCAIKAVGNNATANEKCADLEGEYVPCIQLRVYPQAVADAPRSAQLSCICASPELMNTLEPCVKSDCDDEVWEELRDECNDADNDNGGTGGASGPLSVSAFLASGVAGFAIATL